MWFCAQCNAKLFEEELKKVLPPAATVLGLYLGTPNQPFRIDVEGGMGGDMGGGGVPGGGGFPAGPAGRAGGGGVGVPPPGGDPNNPGGAPGNPNDPNNPNNAGGTRSTMGVTRQGQCDRADFASLIGPTCCGVSEFSDYPIPSPPSADASSRMRTIWRASRPAPSAI